MLHLASFLSFLQFFFAPKGSPWWAGAVWGNVVAIVPCGIAGAVWIKLKLWPLNLLHAKLDDLHAKHDALHTKVADLHDKHDALHQKLDTLASGPGGETSNTT